MPTLTDASSIDRKNIKNMIIDYMQPRIKAITSSIQDKVASTLSTTLTFLGGMTGSGTLSSSSDITRIATAIPDDSHTHDASTIAGSVSGVPDTIVRRDSEGCITSGGESIADTGYKLADGTDISTLFRTVQQARFTAENDTGGTGDYLRSARLSIDEYGQITLTTIKDNLYQLSEYQDITKDGCS